MCIKCLYKVCNLRIFFLGTSRNWNHDDCEDFVQVADYALRLKWFFIDGEGRRCLHLVIHSFFSFIHSFVPTKDLLIRGELLHVRHKQVYISQTLYWFICDSKRLFNFFHFLVHTVLLRQRNKHNNGIYNEIINRMIWMRLD